VWCESDGGGLCNGGSSFEPDGSSFEPDGCIECFVERACAEGRTAEIERAKLNGEQSVQCIESAERCAEILCATELCARER